MTSYKNFESEILSVGLSSELERELRSLLPATVGLFDADDLEEPEQWLRHHLPEVLLANVSSSDGTKLAELVLEEGALKPGVILLNCGDEGLSGRLGRAGLLRQLFDGTPSIGELMTAVSSALEMAVLRRELRHSEQKGGCVPEEYEAAQALHESKERLRRSEKLYRSLFEGSVDGIVFVDRGGTIVDCNESYRKMLGYEMEELLGLNFFDITPERWHEWEKKIIVEKRILKRGYSGRYEKEYVRKDGTVFPVELTAYKVDDAEGHEADMWGVARDLTERKAAEEEIRDLNRRLEHRVEQRTQQLLSANHDLEQIIYAVSHDLRSPLINVGGYANELKLAMKELVSLVDESSARDPERLHFLLHGDLPESLSFIASSIARMDRLLSGLLKFSRLGRASLDMEQLDMNWLLDDLIEGLGFQLKQLEGGIIRDDLPPCYGDVVQVGQVFSNLLSNAIKYRSPERAVKVTVSGEVRDGQTVYCVKDNGLGIPEDQHKRVFGLFYQLDPSSSEGDGLGLTIVRRIVERLGGEVSLESEAGKGSSFFVTLPRSRRGGLETRG